MVSNPLMQVKKRSKLSQMLINIFKLYFKQPYTFPLVHSPGYWLQNRIKIQPLSSIINVIKVEKQI